MHPPELMTGPTAEALYDPPIVAFDSPKPVARLQYAETETSGVLDLRVT